MAARFLAERNEFPPRPAFFFRKRFQVNLPARPVRGFGFHLLSPRQMQRLDILCVENPQLLPQIGA